MGHAGKPWPVRSAFAQVQVFQREFCHRYRRQLRQFSPSELYLGRSRLHPRVTSQLLRGSTSPRALEHRALCRRVCCPVYALGPTPVLAFRSGDFVLQPRMDLVAHLCAAENARRLRFDNAAPEFYPLHVLTEVAPCLRMRKASRAILRESRQSLWTSNVSSRFNNTLITESMLTGLAVSRHSELMRHGLENVVAATTRLSAVDGEAGKLILAGYAVEDLAPNASFEQVAYLFLYGSLRNDSQLADFSWRLAAHRAIPEIAIRVLREAAQGGSPPMDALRMVVPMLDIACRGDAMELSILAISAFPTAVGAYARCSRGWSRWFQYLSCLMRPTTFTN